MCKLKKEKKEKKKKKEMIKKKKKEKTNCIFYSKSTKTPIFSGRWILILVNIMSFLYMTYQLLTQLYGYLHNLIHLCQVYLEKLRLIWCSPPLVTTEEHKLHVDHQLLLPLIMSIQVCNEQQQDFCCFQAMFHHESLFLNLILESWPKPSSSHGAGKNDRWPLTATDDRS